MARFGATFVDPNNAKLATSYQYKIHYFSPTSSPHLTRFSLPSDLPSTSLIMSTPRRSQRSQTPHVPSDDGCFGTLAYSPRATLFTPPPPPPNQLANRTFSSSPTSVYEFSPYPPRCPSASPPNVIVEPDSWAAVKQYMEKMNLNPIQIAEVEEFMGDPPAVQQAKLFIKLLALEVNKVDSAMTSRDASSNGSQVCLVHFARSIITPSTKIEATSASALSTPCAGENGDVS